MKIIYFGLCHLLLNVFILSLLTASVGHSPIAVLRILTTVASPFEEHGL